MFLKIMDSLDLKYSFSVLRAIYANSGTVQKKDLANVVKSHQVLDNLLESLQKDGYIVISSNKIGPRVYSISLTPAGKDAAEKFQSIVNDENEKKKISESPVDLDNRPEGVIHIDGEDIDIKLTPEERENSKYLKFLFHFNVLDNHITVEEAVPGKRSRIFNIYVKQNGNGIFRLWCEQDDSYECWHVKEAWGYPQVQQMMMHYTGKTKICPVCSHENRENANFCENCGAKLE